MKKKKKKKVHLFNKLYSDMAYALERVNTNEIKVLDELKPYFCGRDRNSTIVCLSPTISRKHCIFYVDQRGVTVLDLQSSNGVYINGDKIPPHEAVAITVNDIIGLGSCALDNFTPTDIVYRLKTWDENSKPKQTNRFLNNKRRFKDKINEEVPCKIIKSENDDVEIIEITDDPPAPMEIVDNIPGPSGLSNETKLNDKLDNSRRRTEKINSPTSVKNNSINNIPKTSVIHNDINNEENNSPNKNTRKEKSNEFIDTNSIVDSVTTNEKCQKEKMNSVWIKYEVDISEEFNLFDALITEQRPYAASPLKIKMPKQQTKSRYSDIDGVIHLSDEDEDVFPFSQLFNDEVDTNNEIINSNVIKEEQEDVEIDDAKDLFHSQDKDPPFITLSDDDDDDDDNPWIRRLLGSQSQRESIVTESINNDTKVNINVTTDKNEEMDIELSHNIDQIDSTDLNKTEVGVDHDNKINISRGKKQKKRRESVDKNINNKINVNKDIQETKNLKVNKKTVRKNERQSSEINREPETTSINSDNTKQTHDDESELNKAKSTNIDFGCLTENRNKQQIIDKLIAESSKKSSKRIPQIDPPFLINGERHGVSCAVTLPKKSANQQSTNTKESEQINDSNNCQDTHNNTTDIISKYKKLTAIEKKEFTAQQKMEEAKYLKEQKLRRLKHKFADILPPRTKRVNLLSREEKEAIKPDRKERLKKLAEEKKKPDDNNLTIKRVNKPKAKVSMKNRGDFLIMDQLNDDTNKLPVSKNTTTKMKNTTNNLTKISVKSSDSLETKKLCNEQDATKNNKKIEKTKRTESTSGNKQSNEKETAMVRDVRINLSDCTIDYKEKNNNAPPMEIVPVSQARPQKKRVTFNEALTEVHTFLIAEGNNLNKCVRTDLLLKERPLKKFSHTDINDVPHPRIEEFLLKLFHWNPLWLEEQKLFPTDPPVVESNSLIPVLTTYKSYEDYYKIMSPLLALEMWHGISKDFQSDELKPKRITLQASIVENSVTRTPIPSTNLSVTTFMLEALVTKIDIDRQALPVYGDLAVFELATIHKGRVDFLQIFAYVTSVSQTVVTPFTRYNPDLAKHVKNPHTLMTYTMITRPIHINIQTNFVQRLRTVSYLRSSMRMVQAIQYLPVSPLLKFILQPDIEAYKLPEIPINESYQLVTKDKLNSKQMEAVLRITHTVIQRVPKISMIQGPPGTGKSKVIVNIITEILYGSNRYQSRKHPRILVCAPSNAAIDEIVLRLLAIRANFQPKEQRFRMVRLGLTETMNPGVKSISVTELAKRDVEKTMMECSATNKSSLESIELEKSFLLGRINAMNAEIDSSTMVDNNYKQHLVRKLSVLKARYEFFNNVNSKKNVDRKLLSRLQRSAENAILTGADIITCTLSSCYTNQMEAHFGGSNEKISVCIVDEATQSIEAETLIPLMLGVTSLVLVGDPNQLPATVISQQAKKFGLDQSLFARLQGSFDGNHADPVIMLNMQYRMSYPISYWPNRYFYANRLKNCANIRPLPFHFYKIFNLSSTQNDDRLSNTNEAAFVANIVFTMMTYSNFDKFDTLKIGIITPYNNQRTLINAKLKERIANVQENLRKKIITDVNTVDSFQGQERDIIIMSCVRSNGIGFLSDHQRLCVALTRAKHTLIICGNFKTFERDQMWKALLTDARARGVYFNVDYKCDPAELKKHILK